MLESTLRRQAVDYLSKNFPGLWEKRHGSPLQRAGKWDLMIYWQGCHVEIELKAPGGHLSRPQIEWGLRAERAGCWLYVCDAEFQIRAACRLMFCEALRRIGAEVVSSAPGYLEQSLGWRSWVAPKDRDFLARLEATLKAA